MTTLAAVLGVLGFLLALASLSWQIWSHYAERRESVRATACYREELGRRYGTLRVSVRNVGRVPVYLDAVDIEWELNEPALITGKTRIRETGGALRLDGDPPWKNPLPPGDMQGFSLSDESARHCKEIAENAAEGVCVAVRLRSGSVHKLRSPEVHSIVRAIAQSVIEARSPGQ